MGHRSGLAALCGAALIASCGGGGGGGDGGAAPTYTIGGTATGVSGSGLVLQLNGGGNLAVSADGAFTFGTPILSGASYAVTVLTQPTGPGQTCSVTSGSGTVGAGNVTNVSATCPAATPVGVTATTGNAQASLSWPAVPGATSYNVYSSASAPVTTAGTKTSVSTLGATLPALTNGTPVFAAVTAVGAGGESALSAGVCAVPTAASTAGVTMYDPLCGGTLDGTKWVTPLFGYGVASNAMVLSSQISNLESRTVQGTSYQTLASVVTVGQRVTTLKADITVPQSSASRTGAAEIRAVLRLIYQPPATRLNFPGGSQDQLAIEVGLTDSGSGLQALRTVRHCDSADCNSRSSSGITLVDPAGFTARANGIDMVAAASYDVPYTVSVSLNEATGVLSWSIAGGTFGAGVSGTANPSAYLAATANWTGILPANTGFSSAQAGTRTFDDAVPAGSDAGVSAAFANVFVGFNNLAATLFDDFGGSGGNSGPTELSATKWSTAGTSPGKVSVALTAGSMAVHVQATSPTPAGVTNLQALPFNNPAAINTVQADVTISACSNSLGAVLGASNRVQIQGNFYNDGSPGTTPPNDNRPNGNVGDVRAILILDCVPNAAVARFSIVRLDNQAGTPVTPISNPATSTIALGGAATGSTHTLRLSWDPAAHTFTFVVDGNPVVVNPTVMGPNVINPVAFAKAANSPSRFLGWAVSVPPSGASAGATASMDFKVNNVFTAP